LKEVSVKLILGWGPLTTRLFVANITNKFILGLDVMHAHNASMDLRCHWVMRKFHCRALRCNHINAAV
jgi:hypothetical protein